MNQNAEQRHHTFSNLVLCGKLSKAVRFFCVRETGVVWLPEELVTDKTGIMEGTAETVLAGPHPPSPAVLRWKCMTKRLFLFPWILRRMWSNRSHGNFWGVRVPEARNRRIYRYGCQILGRTEKYFIPELNCF